MEQAKRKQEENDRSKGSSDIFSTDVSDNYQNMNGINRESVGSQRSSYGRMSRVRMKGGKLSEYLTKIRLSKQLSLTDIGGVEYGSLALKKSLSNDNNFQGSFGSPTKKKFSKDYNVKDGLHIQEEDDDTF